jgi:hypothetical protein
MAAGSGKKQTATWQISSLRKFIWDRIVQAHVEVQVQVQVHVEGAAWVSACGVQRPGRASCPPEDLPVRIALRPGNAEG